jgi:putative lipoprotein
MKLVPMLSGVAIAVALSACAGKSAQVPVPAADPNGINTLSQQSIQQPNVSGTIWIKQKVALPPDAVLTVTLSDASLADAPSKVLASVRFVLKVSRRRLASCCRITRQTCSLMPVSC